MLNIDFNVINGAIIIHLEGDLNNNTIINLEEKLNYLIYKQEMHFFIFDFNYIEEVDLRIINNIYNKLIEIFLTCGKAVFLGVNNILKKVLGKGDRIIYVNRLKDAYKYFSI